MTAEQPDPRIEKVMDRLRTDVRIMTGTLPFDELLVRFREIAREKPGELPNILRAVHSDLCTSARRVHLEGGPFFAVGRAVGFEVAASILGIDLGEPILERAKRWERGCE